jgi:hypothetical protein
MKENIESKNIGNRKFIIELRYEPKVTMLDSKGALVEKIQETDVFPNNHWEIGQSEVVIRDDKKKEDAHNVVLVTLNRVSFISYKVNSVESFFASFSKVYEAVAKVLAPLTITRIGCRIIGTYKTTSSDFKNVLKNFQESFPANFLLDKYPAKDMLFNLTYENGMYQIGPVNINDDFYKREFDIPDCTKHVGVAIDTDNYLTNEAQEINEKSLIKEVYMLSLSVEKELYSNLMNF